MTLSPWQIETARNFAAAIPLERNSAVHPAFRFTLNRASPQVQPLRRFRVRVQFADGFAGVERTIEAADYKSAVRWGMDRLHGRVGTVNVETRT